MTVAIQILDRCIALGCVSLALNLGVAAYLIISAMKAKEKTRENARHMPPAKRGVKRNDLPYGRRYKTYSGRS